MTEPATARPGIDPTLKVLLDAFPLTFTVNDGVEFARSKLRALQVPPEMRPDMRTEDRIVTAPYLSGDQADIPVRIYWPPATVAEDRENLPVLVYYHGGGWAIGDLDTHDALARVHTVGADAILVSVDYRLAPEHPFPAGVDDCWATLRWVGDHAEELGGDPNRIAVAGDSAGGNIAAVMALRARDNGGPPLAFQLLWYPATTGSLTLPSFVENADAPILNRNVVEAFLTWYVPDFDMNDPAALPIALAPANADDLSGLAPAYIGTAGYDPLRDDGARYAELLEAAGVAVELHNAPTLVHGFVNFAVVAPAAAEATDRGLAALKKALHP